MKFLKRWIDLPLAQIASRFPFVLIASIATSIYLTLMILDIIEDGSWHSRVIAILVPGIILGFTEGLSRVHKSKSWIPTVLYLLLGFALFTFLMKDGFDEGWMGLRYLVFVGVAHLLFAASLWWFKSENISFWRENISVLLRFLAATLLSALLAGSIILILFLIDYLFVPGEFVDGDVIGITSTWAFLFYHPLYFAKGLLDDLDQSFLENKVYFSAISYILTPLMCVYILIMFAYFIKIAIQGVWPTGGVSYWIAALSVLGTLLYLLGYKYFKFPDTSLNKAYYKWFFILTIPVLGLLFVAIITRVQAYGWTENRFYVVALGLWLLAMSIYYIFSTNKYLYLIPLTLAAVLAISSIGPWGAYDVTVRSQHSELQELFGENGLIQNGKFVPMESGVDAKIQNRMLNIIGFLDDRQGLEIFVQENDKDLFALISETEDVNFESELMKRLSLSRQNTSSRVNFIQLESSAAIRNMDASSFDQVWYYDEYTPEFDQLPNEKIKKQILESLVLNAQKLILDSDLQKYPSECIVGEVGQIMYTFCCVHCGVEFNNKETIVTQLSGILYFKTIE